MHNWTRSVSSHPKRRTARWGGAAFAGTAAATLSLSAFGAIPATAAPTALGGVTCASVSDGQSSGWCALYPGRAAGNVQEFGRVSLSTDGSTLTVTTQSTSTGAAPRMSYACLTSTNPGRTRLQQRQCAAAGGVWIPFTGGSVTIDLSQYPQFAGAHFTVQVAANLSAGNANGDAFYGNVPVSASASTGSGGGGISFT